MLNFFSHILHFTELIFEERNLFTGILLAAGAGTRFKESRPKQFLEIQKNFTIVEKSFEGIAPFAHKVVLALPEGHLQEVELLNRLKVSAKNFQTELIFCQGGNTRQSSVDLALAEVSSPFLFVHDAARAVTHQNDIRGVLKAALGKDAAILAAPVSDTLKLASEDPTNDLPSIGATIDRHKLWAAQTPQAFQSQLFKQAMLAAKSQNFLGTDDASLLENLGKPVYLVTAQHPNPKLTFPADLELMKDHF